MGARGIGHIARPDRASRRRDVGVVLNVGTAHVGEFGSRERTRRRPRASWSRRCRRTGVAVLNADDPLVAAMAARTHRAGGRRSARPTRRRCGRQDVRLDDGRARFVLVARRTRGPTSRCAWSVRTRCRTRWPRPPSAAAPGWPSREVAAALSAAEPASRWRMEVTDAPRRRHRRQRRLQRQPGVDAGRARGAGRRRPAGAARWAVLGEMLELGDDRAPTSTRRRSARRARSASTGWSSSAPGARPAARAVPRRAGVVGRVGHVPDVDAARRAAARARCGPATSCWSRRRAAPASSGSRGLLACSSGGRRGRA